MSKLKFQLDPQTQAHLDKATLIKAIQTDKHKARVSTNGTPGSNIDTVIKSTQNTLDKLNVHNQGQELERLKKENADAKTLLAEAAKIIAANTDKPSPVTPSPSNRVTNALKQISTQNAHIAPPTVQQAQPGTKKTYLQRVTNYFKSIKV